MKAVIASALVSLVAADQWLLEGPNVFGGFRGDVRRLAEAPAGTRIGKGYRVKWWSDETMETDYSASRSQPIVTKDKVIWGTDTTLPTVWAYDRQTGVPVWNYTGTKPTSHGIHGTVWAINNDVGYVGDYDGNLHCLNLNDGTAKWVAHLNDYMGSSPVVYEGIVFTTVETQKGNGWLAATDANTGTLLWSSSPLGGHPHASPAIDPTLNYVCAGCNAGRMECFDFNSLLPENKRSKRAADLQDKACLRDQAFGKKEEETRTSNPDNIFPRCGRSSPSDVPKEPFSVWMYEMRLDVPGYDIDAAVVDGRLKMPVSASTWRQDLVKTSYLDAPVSLGHKGSHLDTLIHEDYGLAKKSDRADVKTTPPIHPTRSHLYISSWNQLVYAFNVEDGRALWAYDMGSLTMSSPALDRINDVVVVGSENMYIHGIDAKTGKPLWKVPVRGDVSSSPTIVHEENRSVAVVGCTDGLVYFINTKTGQIVLRQVAPGTISNPVVVVGDELILLDHSGYLVSYEAIF